MRKQKWTKHVFADKIFANQMMRVMKHTINQSLYTLARRINRKERLVFFSDILRNILKIIGKLQQKAKGKIE